MGNSPAAENFSHPELRKDIMDKYQFRGEIEDERMGKIQIFNHKYDPHK
jgi:serine/threonine protein kinase